MKLLLSFLIALSLTNGGEPNAFETVFKFEIEKADKYYKEIEPDIVSGSQKYDTDPKIVSATIYPELIRYMKFRDFLETKLLEAVYIEKGIGDFSIGRFQMKPSFVRKLETYLKKNPDLFPELDKVYLYNTTSPHEIREERVKRLKDIQWQIIYIHCFYKIVTHKFNGIEFKSLTDKIRFYATAYNHGFNSTYHDIMSWKDKRCFPFGIDKGEEYQFKYSDVSVYFYKKMFLKQ